MSAKRCTVMALSAILLLALVLASSAQSASTAAPTPKATALERVIEGAKAEGTVLVNLPAALTQELMVRLEREIKAKFGVDLTIKFTAVGGHAAELTKAVLEYKAGAPPTYDLMHFNVPYVVDGAKAGIFEAVDWKALFLPGTPPDLMFEGALPVSAPVIVTSILGLMYNPEKVPAKEAPKTFNDLANPKWKGKVGILNYEATWARFAYSIGKDQVFKELRAMLANGAIQGRQVDLLNRYLLGEIWMALAIPPYARTAQAKGMPTAFRTLNATQLTHQAEVVMKGAKHPNAAKLVGVYLASPDGAKFILEEGKYGNYHYPCEEQDLIKQAKREGVRIVDLDDPKELQFESTKEYKELTNQVLLILQGK